MTEILSPSGQPARQELALRTALDAGSQTGANKGWMPQALTPDQAFYSSFPTLVRARARDLAENDALIYIANERVVNHVVRSGAFPQFSLRISDSPEEASAADTAWEESHALWREHYCSPAGYTYAMLQYLILHTQRVDGAVFVVASLDTSTPDICPLRLSLYSVDHLDVTVDGRLSDGNIAIKGRCYGKNGKFAGAYLYPVSPEIPGAPAGQRSVFVPADLLIDAYVPRHASQRTGRPATAAVAQNAYDLKLYREYTMQKAKHEASDGGNLEGGTAADLRGWGAMSTTPPGTGCLSAASAPSSNWPTSWGSDGQLDGTQEIIVGGYRMGVLPAGAKWVPRENKTPGAQYDAFCATEGRRIALAAGAGDLLGTGNYTNYTFAGARSAALDQAVDFSCQQFRLDDMVIKRINAWFVHYSMLYGTVPQSARPADYFRRPEKYWIRIKTQWPGERSMNRYQDMQAAEAAIDMNLSKITDEAAVEGGDYYENLQANTEARRAMLIAERLLLEEKLENAKLLKKINEISGTAGAADEQA